MKKFNLFKWVLLGVVSVFGWLLWNRFIKKKEDEKEIGELFGLSPDVATTVISDASLIASHFNVRNTDWIIDNWIPTDTSDLFENEKEAYEILNSYTSKGITPLIHAYRNYATNSRDLASDCKEYLDEFWPKVQHLFKRTPLLNNNRN